METALLSLGIAFVNISVGIIVLIRGNGYRLARHFFTISLFCAIWSLFDYLSLTSFSQKDAWVFGGIRTVASYFAIVSLLHFSKLYVGNESKVLNVVILVLYILSAVLFAGRFFSNQLVSSMAFEGGYYVVIPGALYLLPILFCLAISIVSTVLLVNYYKKLEDNQRKIQTSMIILGSSLLLVVAVIFYGVLPYFGVHNQSLGGVAMGLFPFSIGISLLKFDLQTKLSILSGNLRSKIFTGSMVAVLFVIIPALIYLNVLYTRDSKARTNYQLSEDIIERQHDLSNYFTGLIDKTMAFVRTEGNAIHSEELQEEINETQNTNQAIAALSIVSADGSEIVGAGVNHTEITAWIGDITKNTPHILGVSSIGDQAYLVVVAPIPGKVTSQRYMVLSVAADSFFEIASEANTSLFDSSKSYIIDNEGRLLTPFGNYDNALLYITRVPSQHVACTSRKPEDVRFTTYLDIRNTPVVGAGVPSTITGWCLVIEVDKAEIEGARYSMITTTVAIALLSVIIVTLIAEVIGSLVSRPLVKLKQGVQRIMAGDYSTPVGVSTDGEIGDLSMSFDVMIANLQDANENVDIKVNAQTENLELQKQSLISQQKQMVSLLTELEREKELSDSLAQDLEKFKQAVEYASDHIIITDMNGITIFANHAVEAITGYSVEEVLGKKAGSKETWGGQMKPDFYKNMWKVLTVDQKPFSGELQNKRKNGQLYIVRSTISPVFNNKGKIVFFVGIERDITKEKEVDKAKSEFVSLASHQLRTPLSAINWYSEMLMDGDAGKLNKMQKQYLQEICDGNQRMIDLVNALLNVSRLELGTFMVEPTEQSITDLGKAALKELKPMIVSKKLIVKEEISKIPTMLLDKKLMYIIFQNLLSNAVKYTPEKGTVTLSIAKQGKQVVITVSDTGMGIPKEQLPRIFEKLFRASNAKESVTEGTGLGLYIVKEILNATGGTISLKSEVNKGSVFTATLPITGMKAKAGVKQLS